MMVCLLSWPDMQHDDSDEQQQHEQDEEDQAQRLVHCMCYFLRSLSRNSRRHCRLRSNCFSRYRIGISLSKCTRAVLRQGRKCSIMASSAMFFASVRSYGLSSSVSRLCTIRW